jgi:hypothetical protein
MRRPEPVADLAWHRNAEQATPNRLVGDRQSATHGGHLFPQTESYASLLPTVAAEARILDGVNASQFHA